MCQEYITDHLGLLLALLRFSTPCRVRMGFCTEATWDFAQKQHSCRRRGTSKPTAKTSALATHSLWPFSMGGRSVMASLTVTVRRGAPAGRLVSTAQ